ncbi:MAG: DUF58 domain-containing protein, partial [Stenotrophomonas sp.]
MRQRLESLQLLARPRQPEQLPTQLDRRRIYVLPTGFGLFLAALLAVMLLGALNYNNNPALLLALVLAATALASSLQAHLQLSGLRLDAISADPVAAGTPIRLRLALARSDGRPRRALQLDCAQAGTHFNLEQHSQAVADLWLPTVQRGWLDLSRIRIATTQP